MKLKELSFSTSLPFVLLMALSTAVWAITGVQVGPSGKTYASAELQCALNPTTGMAPMVQAGLYNPKKSSSATVSLNGTSFTTVSFLSPDTNVWLANGTNTVMVSLNKKTQEDTYSFDATLTYTGQPNVCIPDTSLNARTAELEYAVSGKSYATVTPGCAWNGVRPQPYVNLFDNGTYLLNVSINNVPLTQLSASRPHTPVFLSPGWNVISAANAGFSTDYYVRDGGDGTCTLP